jgi:hypothetical protein
MQNIQMQLHIIQFKAQIHKHSIALAAALPWLRTSSRTEPQLPKVCTYIRTYVHTVHNCITEISIALIS